MGTKFQVAFSRDFLNDAGKLAYGDIGLGKLDESPRVEYRFLEEYTPNITPEQIAGADGLVIIFPHITPETFARGAERLTFIGRCGVGYDRIDLRIVWDTIQDDLPSLIAILRNTTGKSQP